MGRLGRAERRKTTTKKRISEGVWIRVEMAI
jgi:hypothetical protein